MRFIASLLLTLMAQVSYAVDKKEIASLSTEPVGITNYLQMFFGLFIIVALIFGMAWFMRRMGRINGIESSGLKVISGVSVGQRERVVLLQAGDTQLLVGVAPGQVTALHVMDEPITSPSLSQDANKGFSEKLHAAIKSRSRA